MDALSDATSDAPCAVTLYPIPDLSVRDPLGTAVSRITLACWGTVLALCAGTVMSIVAAHWALGTCVPVTALKRMRAAERRRGVGRTILTSPPSRLPVGRLTARTPTHRSRGGVRWESPLAETA